MAYDTLLAEKIRQQLAAKTTLPITEKKMFSGLAFLVNNKMCINVSGDQLMCRFNPDLQESLSARKGYQPMIMKGKPLKGYCYVSEEGFQSKKDFQFWIDLCLAFNEQAKSSARAKKTTSPKAASKKLSR